MEFYELTQADIGKAAIPAFGRTWPVADVVGKVLPADVGRRVYKVSAPGRGQLWAETRAQRDARLADAAKAACDRHAHEMDTLIDLTRRHHDELEALNARISVARQIALDAGVPASHLQSVIEALAGRVRRSHHRT